MRKLWGCNINVPSIMRRRKLEGEKGSSQGKEQESRDRKIQSDEMNESYRKDMGFEISFSFDEALTVPT